MPEDSTCNLLFKRSISSLLASATKNPNTHFRGVRVWIPLYGLSHSRTHGSQHHYSGTGAPSWPTKTPRNLTPATTCQTGQIERPPLLPKHIPMPD